MHAITTDYMQNKILKFELGVHIYHIVLRPFSKKKKKK